MSAGDELVAATQPAAAALVCAVADHDRATVREVLAKLSIPELYAVIVQLAASVDIDAPLARLARLPLSPGRVMDLTIGEACRRLDVSWQALLADDRHRDVADARAVVMAVCREAGLSSTFIGQALCKDHTTVLAAASRVREDRRLREIANDIARHLALTPGLPGEDGS